MGIPPILQVTFTMLRENIIAKTDAEGNTSFFEYDALNRLVKITDPLGGVTRISYDNRNNVLSREDPKGATTSYRYDRNSRLLKLIRPMGEKTSYQYDALGNRIAVFDSKEQKIAYEYDDRNRLVRAFYYSAEDRVNPVKTVNFAYNQLGQLVSYDDGTTSATYTYDDLGRKTRRIRKLWSIYARLFLWLLWQRRKKELYGAGRINRRIRLRCEQ